MKKNKKIARIIFLSIISTLLIAIIAVVVIFEPKVRLSGFSSLKKEKLNYLNNTTNFFSGTNEIIPNSELIKSMIYTSVDDINDYTINAFISIEDKRFFDHSGVDLARIAKAALNNMKKGGYKEGGSTISQQLIKNTHLNNKKTIKRKIEEIRIARALERKYSKDEILKMYLNSLYFGNGIYGIGTAAKIYFGKDAADLSLDESATLAAIINSPAKYCPYSNYENCMLRRNLVLHRMLENKKITKMEYNISIDTNTIFIENPNLYNQYFNNVLIEAAEALDCDIWDIRDKNLLISTYYDQHLSQFIEKVYHETDFWAKDETDFACIVIDNKNSDVVSFYGTGRKNYLNYRRSPASTIKPIISYAPAIESRSVYPISPILDEKSSFGKYKPNNYMDKYKGWISVEDSLCTSSNIAAVKLLDMCGIDYSKTIAKNMGIKFSENDNNLALALGGMEYGVTLQEISNAYQSLANDGKFIKCSYIKNISDENGVIIYTDDRAAKQAITEETAFLINNMLVKCAKSGTARHLKDLENVAAKTGTNGTKEGNTDAYCISYTKNHTVATWIGAKNGFMPNQISGGTIPARINKKIMMYLLQSKGDCGAFMPTKGIEKHYIDLEKLNKDHKVVLANDMTPQIQKIGTFFDKRNLPTENSLKYFNKFLIYKDQTIFSV